jgi:hypothetical protein
MKIELHRLDIVADRKSGYTLITVDPKVSNKINISFDKDELEDFISALETARHHLRDTR